jgi:hypothetical protein
MVAVYCNNIDFFLDSHLMCLAKFAYAGKHCLGGFTVSFAIGRSN